MTADNVSVASNVNVTKKHLSHAGKVDRLEAVAAACEKRTSARFETLKMYHVQQTTIHAQK